MTSQVEHSKNKQEHQLYCLSFLSIFFSHNRVSGLKYKINRILLKYCSSIIGYEVQLAESYDSFVISVGTTLGNPGVIHS